MATAATTSGPRIQARETQTGSAYRLLRHQGYLPAAWRRLFLSSSAMAPPIAPSARGGNAVQQGLGQLPRELFRTGQGHGQALAYHTDGKLGQRAEGQGRRHQHDGVQIAAQLAIFYAGRHRLQDQRDVAPAEALRQALQA